ncbi:hypothetical protein V7157_07825 [Neobacillus drentensis]
MFLKWLLSFIPLMKDKTLVPEAAFVFHTANEGQISYSSAATFVFHTVYER